MRFLIVFTLLFLVLMMFMDYKQGINYSPIPQFTEQELQFICNEEGLNCF